VHDFTNLPHAIHHTSPGETASIGMFLGTGILVFALERKRGFIFGPRHCNCLDACNRSLEWNLFL